MFQQACLNLMGRVYGLRASSQLVSGQFEYSTGTGFMIAPGVIVTAAHLVHPQNNVNSPNHAILEFIRAPDIGQTLEKAKFITEDIVRDLALLKLENARSQLSVTLGNTILELGTSCGSLGFPLSRVTSQGFNLILRFQGAHISSHRRIPDPSGRVLNFYETDSLMYAGSSGCPAFDTNGAVFGLHNRVLLDPYIQNNQPQVVATDQTHRLAISLWIPSVDIIEFARNNGVTI